MFLNCSPEQRAERCDPPRARSALAARPRRHAPSAGLASPHQPQPHRV